MSGNCARRRRLSLSDAGKVKVRRRRIVRCAFLAALAAVGIAAQTLLALRRPDSSPLVAESAMAALGGLRSLAAEAVWFRADRLQDEGRYVELSQLASTLTFLEPHTPEVWSYAAWNLAYNISIMMPTHEDRWRWVLAAIRLLRDDGLRLNPGSPELCRELAWLFELKMGAGIDDASPVYRVKWREIVEDASSRDAWSELGFDTTVMAEVTARYGVSDWTNPLASAIYFAHVGLGTANGRTKSMLLEIIRQSRVMLHKQRQEA